MPEENQKLIGDVEKCGRALRHIGDRLKHAQAYAAQKARFQDDTTDYGPDPRFAVPVSRFSQALPPVKRDMVSDEVRMDNGRRQDVRRIKDQIDRLHEQGSINQFAYEAARLFQQHFQRIGYDRQASVNLMAEGRGGFLSIEDIYARTMNSRDYVGEVITDLGGPTTPMAKAAVYYIGFGMTMKDISTQEGRKREYWGGVLDSALVMMGEAYRIRSAGKPHKPRLTGTAPLELHVPTKAELDACALEVAQKG